MRWALAEIQREDGESVYFRLSTRPLEQPEREPDAALAEAVIAGAYWLREPGPDAELAIAYCGAVAPEALAAHRELSEDIPDAGLLAITSPVNVDSVRLLERLGFVLEREMPWAGDEKDVVSVYAFAP